MKASQVIIRRAIRNYTLNGYLPTFYWLLILHYLKISQVWTASCSSICIYFPLYHVYVFRRGLDASCTIFLSFCLSYSPLVFFLVCVLTFLVYERKCCDGEKVDLDILTDLRFSSPSRRIWNFISVQPYKCMCVCMYVCAPLYRLKYWRHFVIILYLRPSTS